jgi:hypothetical protein
MNSIVEKKTDLVDLCDTENLNDRNRSFRIVIENKKYDTCHEDDLGRLLVNNDRWKNMLLIRYEYYLSKTYHGLGKGDMAFWDPIKKKLYCVELKSLKDKYSSTSDTSKVVKCIDQSIKYANAALDWASIKGIPVTVIEYPDGEVKVEERITQILRKGMQENSPIGINPHIHNTPPGITPISPPGINPIPVLKTPPGINPIPVLKTPPGINPIPVLKTPPGINPTISPNTSLGIDPLHYPSFPVLPSAPGVVPGIYNLNPRPNPWETKKPLLETDEWFTHPGDQTDTRYKINGDTLEAIRIIDIEPSSGSRKSFRKRVHRVTEECTNCTKYLVILKNLQEEVLMQEYHEIN